MQLGLIGFPLKNGFSKAYFENKFRELNMLDSRYDNYPFENINEFKNVDFCDSTKIKNCFYYIKANLR